MNPLSQPSLHPDAESLNAFVEQVLPQSEHQQVLDHIAACSRCREIVYLAQQLNEEAVTPALNASLTNVARNPSWFAGWRLLWIPIAATAALAVATYLYPHRHAPTGSSGQIAQVDHPLTLSAAKPTPPPTLKSAARPEPVPTATASKPEVPIKSSSASAALEAPPPLSQIRSGGPQIINSKSAVPQSSTTAQVSSVDRMGTVAPSPAPSTPVQLHPAVSTESNDIVVRSAPPAVPVAAVSSLSPAEMPTPTESAAVSRSKTAPIQPAGGTLAYFGMAKSATSTQTPDALAARRVLHTKLPSGQIAIAAVAVHHHLLTLDSASTLFLSEDYGKTWAQIAQQWAGRALTLRLGNQPPGSNLLSPAQATSEERCTNCVSASAASAPIQPSPLFEITTDSGSVFTSADGKTWLPKQ